MSINKVFFTGRLTADPVLNTVKDLTCCNFTVASDTRNKKDDGSTETNFYRVSAWRGLGELCAKFLHKGDKVSVTGDLLLRMYTDKKGQERASLQVTAGDIDFPPKDKNADQTTPRNTEATSQDTSSEDELPF